MDYHAHRFRDHSLIAYDDDQPIALFPANIDNDTIYSHQGLTFGGWITDTRMQTATMLQLFEQFMPYLKAEGIKNIVYKAIPHLYHQAPAEEDRYALFRCDAQLVECNVTSVIDYRYPLPFASRRKRGIDKAEKAGIAIRLTNDYKNYYAMLEALLQEKFNCHPTHSLDELTSLAKKFPDNIKLYAAYKEDSLLAGTIIYESTQVAHVQYIASNEYGRHCGAVDALFKQLIQHVYQHKRYFDFGTSNEQKGQYLNEGLINQKEEFGACAVAHPVFRITL